MCAVVLKSNVSVYLPPVVFVGFAFAKLTFPSCGEVNILNKPVINNFVAAW